VEPREVGRGQAPYPPAGYEDVGHGEFVAPPQYSFPVPVVEPVMVNPSVAPLQPTRVSSRTVPKRSILGFWYIEISPCGGLLRAACPGRCRPKWPVSMNRGTLMGHHGQVCCGMVTANFRLLKPALRLDCGTQRHVPRPFSSFSEPVPPSQKHVRPDEPHIREP